MKNNRFLGTAEKEMHSTQEQSYNLKHNDLNLLLNFTEDIQVMMRVPLTGTYQQQSQHELKSP